MEGNHFSKNSTFINAHVDHKCDHEENRWKVCAICGRKIVFGNRRPSQYSISDKLCNLIRKHVNEQFDMSNNKFPVSICGTCRISIMEREKGDTERPIPIMPNYVDINLTKKTRTTFDCNCYVCLTAQFKGHSKVVKDRGHIRTCEIEIDKSNGLCGAASSTKLSSKCSQRNSQTRTSMSICSNCFQNIGKGTRHSCVGTSSTSARRENVLNIVEKLPEKQQNQIVTSILKKRMSDESAIDGDIILNTAGSKLRVTLNSKNGKTVFFTAEGLDKFQATTGATQNHMDIMTNFIRSFAGRKSIPQNYKEHMRKKSNALEDVYKEDIHLFEANEGIVNRPIIYANASELIDSIFEERNVEEIQNAKIKLMADGGQGFFKLCIIILTEEECDLYQLESKRTRYSSGGSISKKCNLNSVYRLIILSIVPQIKETYENLKILFQLTRVNDIPFKFSSDFKILLMINGQQTASATYPCPYCFITLRELQTFGKLTDNEDEPMKIDDDNIILKTFKNLKDDYNKFIHYGKDKKYAKECHSMINMPLFFHEKESKNEDIDSDDENDICMYVLQKCVLPELHLLQGFTNHLFWNGIVTAVGREKALLWPKKLKIVAKNYQGEIFEGIACRKLLQESDKLLDPEIYEHVDPLKLQPYVAAFKTMNNIVHDCFSTQRADITNLDGNSIKLRKALESTGVSQTLKLHVILDHLKNGILLLNKDGLGLWSEQANESVHREFLKF